LVLSVEDTNDPVEVGAATTYRISVRNPGSTAASNVRITAHVPPEMELVRAGGAADHRKDGARVVFEPVLIPAGGEARFEVEAKAVRPADARFRVELTADPLTAGPVQQEESTTIYAMMPSSRLKIRNTSRPTKH
jgi:uncharacterized repeat protein (TIGR01451 family)